MGASLSLTVLVASTLLVIAMGPRAYQTRATLPMALSGIGALLVARMGYVAYNLRHPRIPGR